MVNRADGRKKSDFLQKTTILSGAFFDYFVDGVNYKIGYSDLLSELSVTGTIVSDGASGSTAILDKQGSVNTIRNIENGSGVTSSVSPENGVKIAHNFSRDTAGAPVLLNPTAASPTFASIVAGTGINVASSGDTIVITQSGGTSTNTVLVGSLSDFPTAVGGVITLAADTEYLMTADINLGTSRLVLQDDTQLRGSGRFVTTLTYTGTDAMFTWVDSRVVISSMGISCANGSLVDGSDPTTSRTAALYNLYISSVDTLGTLSDISNTTIYDVEIDALTTDGFTFSGANGYFKAEDIYIAPAAGTMFHFSTATFDGISISGNSFEPTASGVVLLDGAASSANLNDGALAVVSDNRISDFAMSVSTISPTDLKWEFLLNDRLQDSRVDGLVSMQGNATATTIGATGTPVLVAGTWTVEGQSKTTGTTAGRITYNGEKPARLPMSATMTLDTSSGTNQVISVYLAKNGSVIAGSRQTQIVSSGDKKNVSCTWTETLEEADYIEVFVQNETATNSVIVSRAVLRVN